MKMKFLMAAAMLAGLAACGGPDRGQDRAQDVEPEAPVTSASTPVVPAAPDAQTTDRNLAGGALSADGWKDLRIGMTKEEIEAAYGPDANPNAVGGPEPEQCDEFRPENAPEGMRVLLVDGKLARITLIRDAAVKTGAGIGLGASADAVKAAHGGEAVVTPHKYADAPAEYITVWKTGQSGPDYVQDENARGLRYEIGNDGKVEQIHAGGPAIQHVEGCL